MQSVRCIFGAAGNQNRLERILVFVYVNRASCRNVMKMKELRCIEDFRELC